jgi:hypothetical protein
MYVGVVASNGTMYVPVFVKIGHVVEKMEVETNRRSDDLISLFSLWLKVNQKKSYENVFLCK